MPRKPGEIEKLLQNKFGFVLAKDHSSDHRWYELCIDGLPAILTKVSHSKREVGTRLESKIARQLRVRRGFYDGMMNCNKNSDDYKKQVKDDPYVTFQ